jgi:hypothetical protein
MADDIRVNNGVERMGKETSLSDVLFLHLTEEKSRENVFRIFGAAVKRIEPRTS